jgi:hypothetical protein
MAGKKTSDTSVDVAEAILDDDATPASPEWASFNEDEFLKGEKGSTKRDADDADEEDEEEDDDLDGFGVDDEEE